MAFWWVNHKQSWIPETSRGILWAPLRTANDREYPPYSNLKLALPGDVVFSYANGLLGHVGTVNAAAVTSFKPDYASNAPWSDEGVLLSVEFVRLPSPVRPKNHLAEIRPLLPEKYSPIQKNGDGNLTYFSAISEDLGLLLLRLGNAEHGHLQIGECDDVIVDDIIRLANDPKLGPTDRLQLSKARIGQGIYRKRVLALEPICRVTGATTPALLRASHIKPWRASTNAERLDGANGLMLSPHIDVLFDRHLISFQDDGSLLLSQRLDKDVRSKWHVSRAIIEKTFNRQQCAYLAMHRDRLLELDNNSTQ
ncbi:HNH endonuclease [Luteibacter yeojuensis]|uniref:HNH nuclease domain-containing protein n=1 Tax=Luteibacter yeojuensis TaxID=345309 RepID=A0A0F3KGD4_9GAMM|nr:HNH endonuclease [Luteibacter yeojuensis]KJV30047.1 hypothetical protein VI08_15410 [Luteibacter yeojuensis]